ncbi:ead/Ea22-like family protein [Salmonella enterica subsp. enterica serovar Newport]|nr:ead/Ea22-like family protein [Salmonella enterica subsp. enterica serovar Newport]
MTALNKQALIAKIKKQTESFDTVVLKEDEANLLLDELEAAQKLATQQGNIAVALLDEVTTLRRNANDNVPELRECLEAAEKRIAELEARTVNLSKRSVGEVMHMSGFSRDYAEGWCAGNDNAIHEIRTAGIKVKES